MERFMQWEWRRVFVACVLACVVVGATTYSWREELYDAAYQSVDVVDITNVTQLFVDTWLLSERTDRVQVRQGVPRKENVIVRMDTETDGDFSGYFAVVQHDMVDRVSGEMMNLVRMYYRCVQRGYTATTDVDDQHNRQWTCYLESHDRGRTFARTQGAGIEFQGSKQNNIVWKGHLSHNMSPFLDTNPDCEPTERFKALAGADGCCAYHGVYYLLSADGIHWRQPADVGPRLNKWNDRTWDFHSFFDGMNSAGWSFVSNMYELVVRDNIAQELRSVASWIIDDIKSDEYGKIVPDTVPHVEASDASGDQLGHARAMTENYYMASPMRLPDAPMPEIYFVTRFVPRTRIWARPKNETPYGGTNDLILMTKRQPRQWRRLSLMPFLTGNDYESQWQARWMYNAQGCAVDEQGNISIYVHEGIVRPGGLVRRYSLRRHGFGYLDFGGPNGSGKEEVVVTRRLRMPSSGRFVLELNVRVAPMGHLHVEVLDGKGSLLDPPLESMPVVGDHLSYTVSWKHGGTDVVEMEPVRTIKLRVRAVGGAELYSVLLRGV